MRNIETQSKRALLCIIADNNRPPGNDRERIDFGRCILEESDHCTSTLYDPDHMGNRAHTQPPMGPNAFSRTFNLFGGLCT